MSRVQVNRASHEGEYLVDVDNRPLNIRGRTGLRGRGVLGKWGPNHAADPVVTRQGQILFQKNTISFFISLFDSVRRFQVCLRCLSGLFKLYLCSLNLLQSTLKYGV